MRGLSRDIPNEGRPGNEGRLSNFYGSDHGRAEKILAEAVKGGNLGIVQELMEMVERVLAPTKVRCAVQLFWINTVPAWIDYRRQDDGFLASC